MPRVHIFGASGSGTTTLGKKISEQLQIPCFDSDNYYWKKTNIPFTESNPIEERHSLLLSELSGLKDWIISGSMYSWSQPFVHMFQLVVYLYVPKEIRMERLKIRELIRYGNRILPGQHLHEKHHEFLKWADQYDQGFMSGRNKHAHEEWMNKLACPILRIEGETSVDMSLNLVTEKLKELGL